MIDWSRFSDCRAMLEGLLAAPEPNTIPVAQTPFALRILKDGNPAAGRLALEPDLPVEVLRTSVTASDRPCVIEVGAVEILTGDYDVRGETEIASFELKGYRSEANPDYEIAKFRLKQAEKGANADDPDPLKLKDPLLDLVGSLVNGFMSGFQDGGSSEDVEAALETLASTPKTRDRPVYKPYVYTQQEVFGRRRAAVAISLVDEIRGDRIEYRLRLGEDKTLLVAHGLSPHDRDHATRSQPVMSETDLERWTRSAPVLRISTLAAALVAPGGSSPPAAPMPIVPPWVPEAGPNQIAQPVEPGPGPGRGARQPPVASVPDRALLSPARQARIAPGERAPPARAPDAAEPDLSRSLVTVKSGTRGGEGVYLRADLVLTSLATVETATVVDLVAADGKAVPGLVAATDRRLGLALVQSPRPGTPAALAGRHPSAAPGRNLEPGEVLLEDGALVGFVTQTAFGTPKLATGADIASFLRTLKSPGTAPP